MCLCPYTVCVCVCVLVCVFDSSLSNKYGPLAYYQCGMRGNIVINDARIAEKLLKRDQFNSNTHTQHTHTHNTHKKTHTHTHTHETHNYVLEKYAYIFVACRMHVSYVACSIHPYYECLYVCVCVYFVRSSSLVSFACAYVF